MPHITRHGGPTVAASYPVGILPGPPDAGADVEDESPSRPRRSARKPEWVAYAAELGIVTETRWTKTKIIALVGDR